MSSTQTMTEYISQLRELGAHAQLADLDANSFICFYALATVRDTYQDVREDALKLDPAEVTLDKVMKLAKSFETANFAMKNMNKKGTASSNHTFGKKDSRAGNSNSDKSKKHWDKLKSQGKCTRCAN